MMESLFGTSSPMWPGVPAAGWLQSPLSFGARGFAPPGAGISSPSFAPVGTTGAPPLQANGPSPEGYGFAGGQQPSPFSTGIAALTSSVPVVVTPFNASGTQVSAYLTPDLNGNALASLLATIAIKRGQPMGPTNDQEVEDFVYDALEWLQGTNDVEVRCEGGRVTLTGSVPQKRLKRDIGEIAWAIPAVTDVQNTVSIAPRRRSRGSARESEGHASTQTRKA